jgi:hypothetical protein
MFAVYRYHAIFTDSPEPMLDAEATHRDHAVIEQVIADLKESALAHLPSGEVHRERPLAGLRGDRVQPHPRRRRIGLGPPRPRPDRHRPRPADPHPRPDRALRRPPWSCTSRPTGPGNAASVNCSAVPYTTRSRPQPDHRPTRPDRRPPVESRADRPTPYTRITPPPTNRSITLARKPRGGSRLRPELTPRRRSGSVREDEPAGQGRIRRSESNRRPIHYEPADPTSADVRPGTKPLVSGQPRTSTYVG